MMLQDPPATEPLGASAQVLILVFFAGFFSFLVIYYAYKHYQKKMEELKLPFVLILDLTTYKIYNAGVYLGITHDVLIPVRDGVTKQLWAVETSDLYVIPSYGNEEDIIIQSRNMQNILVMLCQVIGLSKDIEAHEEFCKDVFPPELFDIPQKLANIEENYLFVRPLGMRSMIRGMLRQRANGLRHVYAQLYKIIQKYEQQNEEMYTYYDQMFLQNIQSTKETIISNWQNILVAWDFLMSERTVPLYVMARLLHIPQSKLAYSSLNAALSHGGMNDAARFVSAVSQSVQTLASSMNMSMVSTPVHRMVTAKTAQLQGDLISEREKNDRAMEVVKQLADRVKESETTPPPSREIALPAETKSGGQNPRPVKL
jgi:hypothetical protein